MIGNALTKQQLRKIVRQLENLDQPWVYFFLDDFDNSRIARMEGQLFGICVIWNFKLVGNLPMFIIYKFISTRELNNK